MNCSLSMAVDETISPPQTGRLSVFSLFFLSILGYILIGFWFPLQPQIYHPPPADIRTFAPTLLGGLLFAFLVSGLFAIHLALYRRAKDFDFGSRPLALILLGVVFFAVPLLVAYPINATDIFRYALHGRVTAVYGDNPYVNTPAEYVGDPFLPLADEWANDISPYGPLWEIVAAGLTAAGGEHLTGTILLLKGFALTCFLASTVLIWSLLPAGPSRPAHTLLWAWNPGLLMIFVLDGHNDALMILWLLAGQWLWRRRRPLAGFLVMMLAVLTKPIALLALPFFAIGILREFANGKEQVRFVAVSLIGGFLLAWLAFLPWSGSGPLLAGPANLVSRLAQEATASAGFSPSVWLYMFLGQQVPFGSIGNLSRGLFLVFVVFLIWLALRGRSPLRGVADSFLGYVAAALSFRIWYAAWPFAWLLLDAGAEKTDGDSRWAGYRLRAGWWFLLLSQLSVIIYGHVRVSVLGGDQVMAHLIGVPVVFVLPWVLAALPVDRTVDDAAA